ncbi:MAG TPA: BsuPI-related putative proteinase inhibitor [Gemmatimonadaceae bacterium]|nr:BsuPI-related putative proteinase inhibitor [Gemmatimonadaceae bacterium]
MNSRIFVAILGAAALVFATGPRSHSETAAASSAAPASRGKGDKSEATAPLAAELRVSVDDQVRLAYVVTNTTTKQLEVRFPDGRTHDFVILDSLDREVWRWSEGRMFTQSLQNRLLSGGETLSYEDHRPVAALHGRYTAVAQLASVNFPMETRVPFVVP